MPDEKNVKNWQGMTIYEPDPVKLPSGVTWHPGQRSGTDDELSAWAWRVNDHDHGAVFRKVASDVRAIPEHQHIGHRWAGRIAGQLDVAADLIDALAAIVATDTRACAACGHPANVHGRQCWQQKTNPPSPMARGLKWKPGQHVYGGGGQNACDCPSFLAPESAQAIETIAEAARDRLKRGDM